MATSNNTPETITIPLTQEQFTVIDAVDADLALVKWHTFLNKGYSGNGSFIVIRNVNKGNGKRTTGYLHRFVMERVLGRELQSCETIDHINLNTLDNRRCNLRVATFSQNGMNRGKYSRNTSGYKGVSWDKECGKWRAQIMKQGKPYKIGRFDTPEEAYAAYCATALELHGEFARLE